MKKYIVLATIAAMALTLAAGTQAKIDVYNGSGENMNRVVTERTRVSTFSVSNDLDYSATTVDVNNTGGNLVMGGDDVTSVAVYSGDADTQITTMKDLGTTKIIDTSASANGGPDVNLVNAEDCDSCGGDGENMNDLYASDDEFSDYAVENVADIEELEVGVTNTGLNGVMGADDIACVEVSSGHSTHARTDTRYIAWTEITR